MNPYGAPDEERSLLDLEAERGQAEDTLDWLRAIKPDSYAITVVERRLGHLADEIARLA